MPRVPQYNRQVSAQAPSVGTPSVATRPRGSFGGYEAAANKELSSAISRIGQELGNYANYKKGVESEKNALKLVNNFQFRINNLLENGEQEEIVDTYGNTITRPKGILNRKQGQANGALTEFDNSYNEMAKEFETQPANDYEREIFNKLTQNHYSAKRNAVVKHEAAERMSEYKAETQANIDMIVAAASQYTNAPDLLAGMEQAQAVNESRLINTGTTNEKAINVSNKELAGNIAKETISAWLDKEPLRAQSIFERVKDELPGNVAAELDKAIRGKIFADQRVNIWNSLSPGFAREDGSFDTEGMRDIIMELPEFTIEQKEDIVSYSEARSRDSETREKKVWAENDNNFLNELQRLDDAGGSVGEKEILAMKFSKPNNAGDFAKKQLIARKLNDQTKTDNKTYIELYSGIKSGTITEQQLYDNKNLLSGSDYTSLQKQLVNTQLRPDKGHKTTWKDIENLADRKLSNREDKAQYLAEIARQFEADGGGSSDELWAAANEKFDKVKTKWYQFLGGKPKWKVDAQKNQEISLIKGSLSSGVGGEFLDEITDGIKYQTGKAEVEASEYEEFIKDIGGIDNMQEGTPVYKAMQLLEENGRIITPNTINTVIYRHPEWGANEQ